MTTNNAAQANSQVSDNMTEYNVGENKDADWVTPWVNSNFTCSGMEAHNRSMGWIAKAANEIGAFINSETPRHYDGEGCVRFDIGIRGRESGAEYKISVSYNPNRAELLASRLEEIEEANEGYPVSNLVLRGFLKVVKYMEFNVYTYDDRDGTWDHICIDEGKTRIWPGDDIYAAMLCLHDDMTAALDPNMYTLRRTLFRTSRLSYLAGRSTISVHRLSAYIRVFKKIQDANEDDDAKRIAGEYLSMFKDPEYANSPRADANEDDDANPELQNFEGLGSLFG